MQGHRLVVVTPTLKAAQVAARRGRRRRVLRRLAGPPARLPLGRRRPLDPRSRRARPPEPRLLRPGDLLLVDEAGMLDQDTARALLTIADETGARVALVGDRHQLPAVGRGGVLDLAARWAPPERRRRRSRPCTGSPTPSTPTSACHAHRRATPVRSSTRCIARGQIVVHASEVERTAALADVGAAGDLVIADTREQVAALNAAIRDQRRRHRRDRRRRRATVTTAAGERIGARRPGRHPTQRPRPRRRQPRHLDRHRHRRRRQPHRPRPRRRDATLPAEYVARARRARLRHHRLRRPGRDRRHRPPRSSARPPAPPRRTSR